MRWRTLFNKSKPVEEAAPQIEETDVEYVIDFDELLMKVKLLSPRAQAALMYKLAGTIHPTVVNTSLRYLKAQKEHYAKGSKSRQRSGAGGRFTSGKR